MNDDAGSVERAQQGDREAYGLLVEAHYRPVYAIAYAAVGDWSVAQDLSQETFLVAWRQIAMLRRTKSGKERTIPLDQKLKRILIEHRQKDGFII